MTIVVDASSILPLFLKDEARDFGERVLELMSKEPAIAPVLLWYEVRNALLVAERRGRLGGGINGIMDDLGLLPVDLRLPPVSNSIIDLGRNHKLSLYDASYLELALRHDARLATLDGRLAAAAKAENLDLLAI